MVGRAGHFTCREKVSRLRLNYKLIPIGSVLWLPAAGLPFSFFYPFHAKFYGAFKHLL